MLSQEDLHRRRDARAMQIKGRDSAVAFVFRSQILPERLTRPGLSSCTRPLMPCIGYFETGIN